MHKAEFLVFSDIHFTEFNQYSGNDGQYNILVNDNRYYSMIINGVNNRLIDCIKVFISVVD
jgi:hypothetical protein